jgi:small subunit ribosomal protein S17e
MGRIKNKMIKRIGEEMLKRYGASFTNDFQANKKTISKFNMECSKSITNMIAGYITHKVKEREKPRIHEEQPKPRSTAVKYRNLKRL